MSTAELSNQPGDKLQAVLNHDFADPDDDLGADYWEAIAGWFAALSERDKAKAWKKAK